LTWQQIGRNCKSFPSGLVLGQNDRTRVGQMFHALDVVLDVTQQAQHANVDGIPPAGDNIPVSNRNER